MLYGYVFFQSAQVIMFIYNLTNNFNYELKKTNKQIKIKQLLST